MPRFFRILGDAIVLTGGLVMYSGLAIGAFQSFLHPLTVWVWMAILACLGYWIHRGYWKKPAKTMAVVGLSAVSLFLGGAVMALASGTPMKLPETLTAFLSTYFAFFWLPFAVGAAVGTLVSRFARTPAPADPIG